MTITTDGTNHFLGSLYFNASTLAIARDEISTLLTNALGANNFKLSTGTYLNYVIDWRPDIADEVLMSELGTTSAIPHPGAASPIVFARFSVSTSAFQANSGYFFNKISTNSTNSSVNNVISSRKTTGFATNNAATSNCWITADNRSIAIFTWNQNTNHYLFTWTGVTKNNPSGFDTYPANCCCLVVANDGNNQIAAGVRAAFANSNTPQNILTTGKAQYALTCSDSQTPGADLWTSDFWLIDDDSVSGNPASGRCSNLLLGKGASFEIGSKHSLKTPNKDGGSNNFLCVAEWGDDKILMRITEE